MSRFPIEGQPKGGRKRKPMKGALAWVLLFILGVGLIGGYYAVVTYMPSFQYVDLYSHDESLDRERSYIMLGNKRLTDTEEEIVDDPVVKDGEIYLPVSFIKKYVDNYIFWDDSAQKLTITTENRTIRMKTDELTYYVNNKPMQLNIPVHSVDGKAYLPQVMAEELYDVRMVWKEEYKTLIVDYTDREIPQAAVTEKKTVLRYEADDKSPIEENLVTGDVVTTYETEGKFVKARTENGLVGYIPSRDIEAVSSIPPSVKAEEPIVNRVKPIEGKVNLVWDQVTTVEANGNENRRIVHPGVNVLSPTWFSFDADKLNGDIVNIADLDYVNWAHENGYQVWALITDNFDSTVSHAILSSTETREHVIRQLLALVSTYKLDGINFDFERVAEEDGEYYLQFFRELAPFMKEQGCVVSVDAYVPSAWSRQYMRGEVAKVVDFMCVMAYDEHWSVKEPSGPVASIGFVRKAVDDMINQEGVPKEKVVLGMPMYVRVWGEQEENGEISRTLSNYGMEYAYQLFTENGAEFQWVEESGCYYGEYTATENGKDILYRVWLEDERSIEEKLKVFKEYEIGGVASWKRGLEKDGIWELVESYVK